MEMLHDMSASVKASGADMALGFDGDGDRCGVVDDEGEEIFADKVGVIMARDLSKLYPNATFVADVKSTGLFASDPELQKNGVTADYWKTGHSHMKRRVKEIGALAGFEKSGHYFLAEPVGRGYDCGMRVAVEICKLMERNPDMSMSDLRKALPKTWSTPTMSPHCADTEKYTVLERLVDKLVAKHEAGETLAGRAIKEVVTVNGARVILDNGSCGAGARLLQHAKSGGGLRKLRKRSGNARDLCRYRRGDPDRAAGWRLRSNDLISSEWFPLPCGRRPGPAYRRALFSFGPVSPRGRANLAARLIQIQTPAGGAQFPCNKRSS